METNETKHTPQEWYAKPDSGGQALIFSATEPRTIAVAYAENDGPLLAAAPELMAALEQSLALLDEAYTWNSKHGDNLWAEYPRVQNNARAAIAKACGGGL